MLSMTSKSPDVAVAIVDVHVACAARNGRCSFGGAGIVAGSVASGEHCHNLVSRIAAVNGALCGLWLSLEFDFFLHGWGLSPPRPLRLF